MEDSYFKSDQYWKEHIHKKMEDDIWIREYKKYFSSKGQCLDLGCGVGQYSKELIDYGFDVTSADISDIALKKVKEFNDNTIKLDMKETFPFSDNIFDMVFANLSIHYFNNADTKNIMKEIKRILKIGGLFIGSVNSIQGIDVIKDTAIEIEPHFYLNKQKYVRLFDKEDLQKYLDIFEILNIEERQTIRFEHKKNYIVFFCKKELMKGSDIYGQQ